jgi:hypothetical protein
MKPGDLVEVTSTARFGRDATSRGIVIRFDVYHPEDYSRSIPIVEVLLSDGPRWVNRAKIKIDDDAE